MEPVEEISSERLILSEIQLILAEKEPLWQ